MRIGALLALGSALACGPAEPSSNATEGGDEPIEAMLRAAGDPNPDTDGAPDDSDDAIPTDFTIVFTRGGVTVPRDGDPGARPIRIEARPDGGGDFDLVVMETWTEIGGRSSGPRPVFRVGLPADDVRSLHALFRERRSELDAPCIDHSVRDGGWRAINVRVDGADHRFQCTNATTPAFDALAEAIDRLVQTHSPAR